MLLALQAKFDYIAHKIADDCTSLCSARFTTTTHKTDSSLSLVLFMLAVCFVSFRIAGSELFSSFFHRDRVPDPDGSRVKSSMPRDLFFLVV